MIVCFDIGGTAIKGALARSAEDIRAFERIPTPTHDFDAFVDVLRNVVNRAERKPDCVSISIAGVIDAKTKRANVANVPCIHGRALQADLEAALNLPVLISNDADCFAIAEAGLGAGKGHRVVFGVILGTGVGGGLVIDGKLINFDGGFAGEWGHGAAAATRAGDPFVEIPQFQCGCGLAGCLDAVCSARGLEKLHKHLHSYERDAEDILRKWQAGDGKATQTVAVYCDLISSPLALAINLTGTTIVPVGGGLSNVPALIAAIDEAVRKRILAATSAPIVVPATCREIEPGIIGAALIGFSRS